MRMESLLSEQSLSPTKQTKNSRRKTYHLQHQHQAARLPNISRQSSCGALINKNYAPPPYVQMEMVHAITGSSVFLNHFPKQYPQSSSLPPILPTYYQNHHNHHQQPPLLPLPVVSKPVFRSLPLPPLTRGHSLSSSALKKQPNKPKMNPPPPSTTNKKTPQNQKKTKNYNNNNKGSPSLAENDQQVLVGPAKGKKPDPGNDPKEVTRIVPRVLQVANHNQNGDDVDEKKKKKKEKEYLLTAASVFSLSPPPSSLPLPKFPLKKIQQNKLSCNAEAIDMGATDNLCRLLKLR